MAGVGTCYYKASIGTEAPVSSGGTYAVAYQLSPAPKIACPAYNNAVYTDSTGQQYSISCGYDSSGASGTSNQGLNMTDCMLQCDAKGAACQGFSYKYSGTSNTGSGGNGLCYFKSSVGNLIGGGSTTVNIAAKTSLAGSTPPSSVASNAAATTTAGSGAATTSSCPAPTTSPSCPAFNNTMFTDGCGLNYTIYCGYDTSPGQAGSASSSTFSGCFPLCDAYPGCKAFTYSGNTCYFKTSYNSKTANSNVNAAVLYVPPNVNYNVPATSGSNSNTSSGCGSPLPARVVAGGSSTTFNFLSPDGNTRTYAIRVPALYNISRAAPLIFSFHGRGDTAANQEALSGFSNDQWNPYGIAVYPSGVNVSPLTQILLHTGKLILPTGPISKRSSRRRLRRGRHRFRQGSYC
jgi:hypothetical protein